jgi:hypothetical protein
MEWSMAAGGVGLAVLGAVGLARTFAAVFSLWHRAAIARLPVAPEGDFTLPAAGAYRVELEYPRLAIRPLKRAFGGRPSLTAQDLSAGEVVALTPPSWRRTFYGVSRARLRLGTLRVSRGGAYRLLCAARGGEAAEALSRDRFQLVVTRPYVAKFVGLILGCNVAAWALAGGVLLLIEAYSRMIARP